MIYNIITTQLLALLVLAFLQPNRVRSIAAGVFVGLVLLHELLLSDADGIWYFGSAAIFALAIVMIISDMKTQSPTTLALQRVAITSMAANLIGYIFWHFYFPPLTYELIFVAIYSWAIAIMIRRQPVDIGRSQLYRWMFGYPRHDSQSLALVYRRKGQT